jgi:hypothetical protein
MNTLTRKILVAGALIAAATTASAQAMDPSDAPSSDDSSVSVPADQAIILLVDPSVLDALAADQSATSDDDDSSASAADADDDATSSD